MLALIFKRHVHLFLCAFQRMFACTMMFLWGQLLFYDFHVTVERHEILFPVLNKLPFFFFFCFRASNGIKYAVELGMLENVPQPFYEMPWLDITKCFVLTVTRPNVWNFWFKFRIITVWLYLFLKSKFLVYLTWGFFLFGKIFYQLGEFVSASLGCAYQHITLLYLYCFVIVNVVIDLFMMLCRPSVRLTWCFKS